MVMDIGTNTAASDPAGVFRRDGWVVLPRLLEDADLAALADAVADQRHARRSTTSHAYQQDGSTAKLYLVTQRDDRIREVLLTKLKTALLDLTGHPLLFSHIEYFVQYPGAVGGWSWHFGLNGYGPIDAEDRAYTLWMPLAAIDPNGQRGGISYVPQWFMSGRERVRLIQHISRQRNWRELIPHVKLAYEGEVCLLDAHQRETSIGPGDAFFFNRYVYHKTQPLLPGPIAHRAAIGMRFIDVGARYCKSLHDTFFSGHIWDEGVHDRFCHLQDGAPISDRERFIELSNAS